MDTNYTPYDLFERLVLMDAREHFKISRKNTISRDPRDNVLAEFEYIVIQEVIAEDDEWCERIVFEITKLGYDYLLWFKI